MSLLECSSWTVLCILPAVMQEDHNDEDKDGRDDGDHGYPPYRATCSSRNLGLRRLGFQGRQQR